jgi:hypothetical protein
MLNGRSVASQFELLADELGKLPIDHLTNDLGQLTAVRFDELANLLVDRTGDVHGAAVYARPARHGPGAHLVPKRPKTDPWSQAVKTASHG